MTSKCIIQYRVDLMQNISSTFLDIVSFCRYISVWVGWKVFFMLINFRALVVISCICLDCDFGCVMYVNVRICFHFDRLLAVEVSNCVRLFVAVRSAFIFRWDCFSDYRIIGNYPVHHSFILRTHLSTQNRSANLEAISPVTVHRTLLSFLVTMEAKEVIMDCMTWVK